MSWLSATTGFPDPIFANKDGLLAIGGDLSAQRLCSAYENGIFPWYNSEDPILWWSPDPRMVLFPSELHISKSMKKLLKDQAFELTYNKAFEQVIRHCSSVVRLGQDGTWLGEEMIQAYIELHQQKMAHSVEVWQEGQLVGGFYGVRVRNIFCGESMFSLVSNASKYGFISFVKNSPDIKLIDCQVYSDHLASLGAREIPREEFLKILKTN